jgi:hypothetical protein
MMDISAGQLDKESTKARYNGLIALAFSLLFALLFQAPNWPDLFYNLHGFPMRDRYVYETMILSYSLPTDYIYDFSAILYFTSEWLWNFSLSYAVRNLGISIDTLFFVITTIVLWRMAYEVFTRAGAIYVPLLVNPLVVDFAFSQLRLALAISLVSFFWNRPKLSLAAVAAYIACTSIHTSIVLFAVMHLAAHYAGSRPRVSSIAKLVIVGFAVSMLIGPLRGAVLGLISDRRADFGELGSTPVYMAFWIAMLALMVFRWRQSLLSTDSRYAVIILSTVFFNLFTAGYSTRFIAAAFPALIVAMSQWRSGPINLMVLAFVPYAAAQWLYWLKFF